MIVGPGSADHLAANRTGLAFTLPEPVSAHLDATIRCTVTPPVTGQHNAA